MTIEGYDPQEFMERITELNSEIQRLAKGMPFRSVAVRSKLENLIAVYTDLIAGMKQELEQLKVLGD